MKIIYKEVVVTNSKRLFWLCCTIYQKSKVFLSVWQILKHSQLGCRYVYNMFSFKFHVRFGTVCHHYYKIEIICPLDLLFSISQVFMAVTFILKMTWNHDIHSEFDENWLVDDYKTFACSSWTRGLTDMHLACTVSKQELCSVGSFRIIQVYCKLK